MITNDPNPQAEKENIDLTGAAMPAPSPASGPDTHRLQGSVIAYFETGTEGRIWAMEEDGKLGYDALKIVEQGDHLLITAPDGKVLFDGDIDADYEIGKQPRYPGDPWGQPVAQGCRVHWTQKGWSPDDWAALFIPEINRAVLTKGSQSAA